MAKNGTWILSSLLPTIISRAVSSSPSCMSCYNTFHLHMRSCIASRSRVGSRHRRRAEGARCARVASEQAYRRFRRATGTPFDMIFDLRPLSEGRSKPCCKDNQQHTSQARPPRIPAASISPSSTPQNAFAAAFEVKRPPGTTVS